MELLNLLHILWRWALFIIGLVAITIIAILSSARSETTLYSADATLQITTPDRDEVAVIDAYTFTSERDEVTVALNNFLEIAKYPQIKEQTKAELNIDEDYQANIRAELGADLVYIAISASTADLAAEIANAHANNAIEHFGQVRALPLTQALNYFSDQLDIAKDDVTVAEDALLAFQLNNGITSLDDELALQRQLLGQLEEAKETFILDSLSVATANDASSAIDLKLLDLEIQIQQQELANLQLQRDTLLANPAANAPAAGNESEASSGGTVTAEQYNAQIQAIQQNINQLHIDRLELEKTQLVGQQELTAVNDATNSTHWAQIQQRIADQRAQIASLIQLEPEFVLLQANVANARERFDLLAKKYTETDLKKSFASQAMFIQVIDNAQPPVAPDTSSIYKNLLLGGAGSLGAAVLLAFLLDYILGGRPPLSVLKPIFQRKRIIPKPIKAKHNR